MRHLLAGIILLSTLAGRSSADPLPVQPPGFDPQRHMRISEVKDGMKGYGLSVFRGTKIEKFEVEVISVLRNFNPKHDVVLVRLKGANLEHTGAIQGMSGSPIFLTDEQGHDRMIGAFAYGWPLVKDPIGGVQPIEYMLAIPAPPTPTARIAPASQPAMQTQADWSVAKFLSTPWMKHLSPDDASPAQGQSSGIRPLATPMMVSGIPDSSLQEFQPLLKAGGVTALQAGSAGIGSSRFGMSAKLEPGSAIAIPLMTGDADMTAIGTVTEVVGDRVLGFGHPFFSEGDVSLPMSSGYIHFVVPNLVNSFKLGASTALRGTLQSDQSSGIAGKMGEAPATIPIEMRCVYTDGTYDRTFRFNAVQHHRFTPILGAVATMVSVQSSRELPKYHTIEYDLSLEFANGQNLRFRNRVVNGSVAEIYQGIGQSIVAASENPFERVPLRKMTGLIMVSRDPRLAEILSVSVPRSKYRPGDDVKAFVTYRPFRGVESILPLEFALPRDLPEGNYDFAVFDAQQYLADEQAARPFRFTAENSKEMFAVLGDLAAVRRDALYLRLMRQADGVAIGRVAMPHLPSSRRKMFLSAGRSNTTQFVSTTLKVVPTDYVMTGQARFNLTIDKDAKVDTAARPARHDTPPAALPKVEEPKAKAAE